MAPTHLDLAVDLAGLFDEIGVRYVIGGSVASSLIGEPRSTVDVDIAVELELRHLDRFLQHVRPNFYVPERDAARAVREADSFNIIHNEVALKIDLFVLGANLLDTNQIARRMLVQIPTVPAAALWITSPEDQVLRKLDWYRQGGQVSDRQMRDIIAILQINRQQLDFEYLTKTAELVGLSQLLRDARQSATS